MLVLYRERDPGEDYDHSGFAKSTSRRSGMQSNKSSSSRSKILLSILALSVLAGFAIQNVTAGAKPQSTVTLAYQFTEGKTLIYQITNTQTQNLDIMGQAVSTESNSSLEFTLQPKGLKEGQYQLGVTINAFKFDAQSPQGGATADASSVVGKSFDMILSRLGKEIDTSGASSLRYTMGIAGTRDLGASFQALLPDLPETSVKIGDAWPSQDSIIQKSDGGDIHVNFNIVNTSEGIETIDGLECMRIKGTVTGKMTGNLEQQGMALLFDAKIDGTQTWYFAVKEGIFVKSETKATLGGIITAGDPANITIPMTGEMRTETHLVKK
jgi:hypothetical protein